jgi:hypothetical protein
MQRKSRFSNKEINLHTRMRQKLYYKFSLRRSNDKSRNL